MREQQRLARRHRRCDVAFVDRLLFGVRREDHDQLRFRGRIGHRPHTEPGRFSGSPALRAFAQSHAHITPALLQIQRVCVTLTAVADDRDGTAVQARGISILVIENAGHAAASSSCGAPSACAR